MKIEILSRATGSLVKKDITSRCEIGSSENERIGDSLNTLTFTVSPVTKEECFEPGTCIRFTYDDNTYLDFAVVSDTVKMAQKGSTKGYTHEIQCVQWARKLCYRLMRGKDLSQPYNAPRKDAVLNELFFPISVPDDVEEGKTQTYHTEGQLYSKYYSRPLGLVQAYSYAKELVKVDGVISMSVYALYNKVHEDTTQCYCYFYNNANLNFLPKIATSDGSFEIILSDMTSGNGATHTITQSEADQINAQIKNGKTIVLKMDEIPDECFDATKITNASEVRDVIINLRYSTDTYRYTYKDVLEYIAKCATSDYDVKNSYKGTDYSINVSANLPFTVTASSTGLTSEMLALPAPDFQFQQNTSVYDAVAEVLKTLGGKPTLDFDGNLGISFFNKRSTEISKDNFIDEMRTVTDSKRTNSVVLPYQNGTPRTTCHHPILSGSTPRYTHPRCKNLGIAKENDYYLMTENPIYQVKEVRTEITAGTSMNITLVNSESSFTSCALVFLEDNQNSFDLDITDFVFDTTSYNLLNELSSSSTGSFEAIKQNSLNYDVGDNAIYVGNTYNSGWFSQTYYVFETCVQAVFHRMFLADVGSISTSYTSKKPLTYQLRCVYYPVSTSGNVRVESPIPKNYGDEKETEIVVAQKSGIVSLEKLGLSALGSVSMLGEETMTATYRAYCYTTKKPLAGMWLKDGNDYWLVSEAKSTQLIDGTYKAILTLSKGFNKVSDRVQIDRNLRMTEISQNLVLKSEVMLRDYIYFTDGEFPKTQLTGRYGIQQYTALTSHGFAKIYGGLFNWYWGRQTKTSTFYLNRRTSPSQAIIAPHVCYGAGNSICFESNFTSPTSAGNCTKQETSNIMTRPVIYTDSNGFADYCAYSIVDGDTSSDAIQYSDDPYLERGIPSLYPFQYNFDGKIIGVDYLMANKSPNDILGFNYQVFLLPYEGGQQTMIIYPYLASHHPYVSGKPWQPLKLYINTSSTPYSMFESTPRGTLINSNVDFHMMSVAEDSTTTMNKCEKVQARNGANTFDWIYTPSACNGWMLTEQNGTPLLASNKSLGSGSLIYFHVFASHKRL